MDYSSKRKTLSKFIIGYLYLAFITFMLGQSQLISDWNYSIHEIMYLPTNLAFVLLPIMTMFWLYNAIKSRADLGKVSRKPMIRSLIVLITVVLICSYFYGQTDKVSTSGIYVLDNKIVKEGTYYLLAGNQYIECSVNEYNLVDLETMYMLSFIWHERKPTLAKLIYIEEVKDDSSYVQYKFTF